MSKAIDPHPVTETLSAMADSYVADGRPWVVAYSGGKDSTLVLQLVYETLAALGPRAIKPVFVVSSDTGVEPPNVAEHVGAVLAAVRADARRRAIGITPILVQPTVEDGFWGKLIGRGYPPPTRWFRWCTTNMKIKPSRRAIDKIVAEHGSVVLFLGSRRAESSSRAARMDGRRTNLRQLNPHHEIPNAFVATPIADWSDDDVWQYLYENNPPPWGLPHDRMLTLYRQALGGECPIVMDLNTPSCGGSRFGCWVCTVVKVDKSMEGFIQSGETWMAPLAGYRDWLKKFRDAPGVRMDTRRDGSKGPGPFTFESRQKLLSELLKRESDVKIPLISDDEIRYIQGVWSAEFDLENNAIRIARQAGREIAGGNIVPLSPDDRALLDDIAADHGINPNLIAKVLEMEGEFPNLDSFGAKPALKRVLTDIIVAAEGAEAGA
ncbi:MAG: DNA phosphorothioation system sulfurtransferase DndC [Alphaproteobacteria bacterium]|nr:DNA phosphorothioation system sulfurtransferase DndC [Alphaproteobacteria bacterium]